MFVFYFFAAVLLFLGYKSLRGGFYFSEHFKRELRKNSPNYAPKVSIIAPCKGLDEDLEKNLEALFGFDYPHYEIVFSVESKTDEAVATIEKLINSNAHIRKSKLVVAEKTTGGSQKIRNLLEALKNAAGETEVFVFADSDARPNRDWLKYLVAPLEDKEIGAATGYRWFVQKTGGLATHLRAVWNASITSALGANTKNNFCWGGATAIRRETFYEINMPEKWRGVLSSDFALTNAVKAANLKIYFVPQCVTASVEDTNFSEMLEFTTRQMQMARLYSPARLRASLLGSFLFSAVFFAGILLLFLLPADSAHFWLTLGFVLLIFALGAWKSILRLQTVAGVLPEYRKELDAQTLPHFILWIFTPILFFYNDVFALCTKKMKWRGIVYRINSPNSTEILEKLQ